jgi:AcrR family transcriptional regulator
MSSTLPRRHLSERRADTVGRLTAAAVEELREGGLDGLTVRNVARRAGVAPATAYTYFASKEHLVTEVYLQRVATLPEPEVDPTVPPAARVAEVLEGLGLLVADEPELAAACTIAMLASDPEVARVRDAIGTHTVGLLRAAVGDVATPAAIRTLDAAFSGLMVQAGVGHIDYRDIAARMAEVAEVVFGDGAVTTDAGADRLPRATEGAPA